MIFRVEKTLFYDPTILKIQWQRHVTTSPLSFDQFDTTLLDTKLSDLAETNKKYYIQLTLQISPEV